MRIFILVLIGSLSLPLWAQPLSRSGQAGDWDQAGQLRRFPCGGTTVWEADFDSLSSLPADWQVLDEDGQTPNQVIQFITPAGGWQLVDDFNDSTSNNRLLVSPSWYEDETKASDDWLILPQRTNLPADVCLSWYAFSQDIAFKEAYEVWVSTTGSSIADLENGTRVFATNAEENFLNFQSTSLAAFAGEDVYIAFHHISDNEFLLGLDDIRLAQVGSLDMAINEVEEIRVPINTDVFISGSVINLGLDTLSFDTGALTVFYQIDSEAPQEYNLPTDVLLLPNDTINFRHDSVWVPDLNKVYILKVWLAAISGDVNLENDTLFRFQGVGSATQRDLGRLAGITHALDPISHELILRWPAPQEATVRLWDAQGRMLRQRHWELAQSSMSLVLHGLPAGMYMVGIESVEGKRWQARLLLRE